MTMKDLENVLSRNVKRLFKLAEKAGDDVLMGAFLAAFDRTIRRVRKTIVRYRQGNFEEELVVVVPSNTVMPRPDTRYGASKAFGEALGRLYADKHGISVACLRIGSFQVKPQDERQLATWISPRDTVELVRCCIEAPDYHFLIVYGVSNNRDRRWFDRASRLLGYAPQDDAEAFAAEIRARGEKPDAIAARFHGGPYCAMEFSGDVAKID